MRGSKQGQERKRGAFTLVEIIFVVAIIAMLAAIAIPGFMRARKRAQAAAVKNDLRLVESAVEQYALETGKAAGVSVAVADWTGYVKGNSRLYERGEDILATSSARKPSMKCRLCRWKLTRSSAKWRTRSSGSHSIYRAWGQMIMNVERRRLDPIFIMVGVEASRFVEYKPTRPW